MFPLLSEKVDAIVDASFDGRATQIGSAHLVNLRCEVGHIQIVIGVPSVWHMPPQDLENTVMSITAAIVHESYANRTFRRIAPFAVLFGLVALILAPGMLA